MAKKFEMNKRLKLLQILSNPSRLDKTCRNWIKLIFSLFLPVVIVVATGVAEVEAIEEKKHSSNHPTKPI